MYMLLQTLDAAASDLLKVENRGSNTNTELDQLVDGDQGTRSLDKHISTRVFLHRVMKEMHGDRGPLGRTRSPQKEASFRRHQAPVVMNGNDDVENGEGEKPLDDGIYQVGLDKEGETSDPLLSSLSHSARGQTASIFAVMVKVKNMMMMEMRKRKELKAKALEKQKKRNRNRRLSVRPSVQENGGREDRDKAASKQKSRSEAKYLEHVTENGDEDDDDNDVFYEWMNAIWFKYEPRCTYCHQVWDEKPFNVNRPISGRQLRFDSITLEEMPPELAGNCAFLVL